MIGKAAIIFRDRGLFYVGTLRMKDLKPPGVDENLMYVTHGGDGNKNNRPPIRNRLLRSDPLSEELCSCSSLLWPRQLDDRLSRADLLAETAVLALMSIDDSVVVLHLDSFELAGFLALLAADASGLAGFLCSTALVAGTASYIYYVLLRNHVDNLGRARRCTGTASYTVVSVDPGNSVNNADGIEVTCLYTIAHAQAAVLAGTVTVVHGLDALT